MSKQSKINPTHKMIVKKTPILTTKLTWKQTTLLQFQTWKQDKTTSAKTIIKIHNDFRNVFRGIGNFKGTFFLKVKDNVKLYHMPSRCVAYALKGPFINELECL